jgi:bifunctional DNase/RNase
MRSSPISFPRARLRSVASPSYSATTTMIEMQLEGVRVELPTNQPIVLLRERDGERYLPIWIGASEAAAIALSLQGVQTPRPMTHDLMKNILEDLSVAVHKIVVTELRDSTFYATIELQRNGDRYEVSSRPSDAIALAVRLAVPIFASEEVLDEAAILIPGEEEEEVEKFREFLDNVTPEDFNPEETPER